MPAALTADTAPTVYVGRFAPSPSGPLHMGSLLTALASFLDARAHQGRWLLRIEDLDPPREQPGADKRILASLEAHHLHWDGPVCYQSQRHAAYAAAIDQLQARGQLFYCRCSRRELRKQPGHYPGTCRPFTQPRDDSAIRCRIDRTALRWHDLIQGWQDAMPDELDDVVIRRRDGLYAYQLAVVVDDAWQGISHVIRGIDLISATPWQYCLQQSLGLPSPRYGHLPVLVNAQGQKLSKQHHAPALDDRQAGHNLWQALQYLQLSPPLSLRGEPPQTLLRWAQPRWRTNLLRGLTAVPEADNG